MAKTGDILLSVRAPVGTINITNVYCCIGRGLAAINSERTTFGSITKADLFSLAVLYPEPKLLQKYDKIVSKYNQLIFNNANKNE